MTVWYDIEGLHIGAEYTRGLCRTSKSRTCRVSYQIFFLDREAPSGSVYRDMGQAVQIVRPALDKFYNVLTDEQKARFNALEPQPTAADVKAQKTDISQACSANVAKTNMVPTAKIEQALRPTSEQRAALENLNAASAKAAEMLAANCPTEETLTPPGRLAAMEGRLDAMLKALDLVQPALTEFYNSLSDEQKARFNQLGTRQQAARR